MVTFVPRQILEQVKRKTRLYIFHIFQTDGCKYSQSDKDLTLYLQVSSPVNLRKELLNLDPTRHDGGPDQDRNCLKLC